MKLLFENWRKFVNEADDDIRSQAGLPALQGGEVHSHEDEKAILKKAEELIEKYSLNSRNERSSDHRWGRGMPMVDYDFNVHDENRLLFHATLIIEPKDRIAPRDLQGEHELEKRLLGILNKLGLGPGDGQWGGDPGGGLTNINFYDEEQSGPYPGLGGEIHLQYGPLPDEAWDLRGFESFLKRIRDISDKFDKFRIVDQLYKQGELDLEPTPPEAQT